MAKDGEVRKKRGEAWSLVALGLSEVLGTALLLLFGCMGGLPGISSSEPTPLQSALVFGLTVSTIVQVFGHVSGAHLNPAVTVAAWIMGFTPTLTSVLYVVAQFVGATIGYATLVVITPEEAFFSGKFDLNATHAFCATTPGVNVNVTQALLGEFLATSMLILLCCGVWDKRNEAKQDGVPLKFGLTIAALAMSEGPYSGCSMNPARSFGPALITGEWRSHWIYWLGPMLAGVLMPYFYKFIFDRDNAKLVTDKSELPLNHREHEGKESMEALPTV